MSKTKQPDYTGRRFAMKRPGGMKFTGVVMAHTRGVLMCQWAGTFPWVVTEAEFKRDYELQETPCVKIEIDVTQADIDAGNRRDCSACPIALAASRALGKEAVTGGVLLAVRGSACVVHLPAIAKDFILGFDRDQPVAPFRFTVSVPE